MTSSFEPRPARRSAAWPSQAIGPGAPGGSSHLAGPTIVGRALQLLAVAALAVSAYLHVDLAGGYDLIGEQVTLGDLFRLQAASAAIAGLALLVRPVRLSWALAALVGFASLAALVLTVYVAVPAIGPLPRIHEPIWFLEKTLSAVAAALAAAAAALGLLTHRPRVPGRGPAAGD